jgi:hypothetical protein
MKSQIISCSLAILMSGFFAAGSASAVTQTITASAQSGGSTNGTAAISTTSTVTCTQASGGGDTSRCSVQAPGWSGALRVGQSIGTTGAGNVVLNCGGIYPASGGRLTCTATVADTVCTPSKSLTAGAKSGQTTNALAPIKNASTVTCTQASGGSFGTTCGIVAPGFTGVVVPVGQSVTATGPGTVSLGCNGSYPASGGSLTCAATISQTCP